MTIAIAIAITKQASIGGEACSKEQINQQSEWICQEFLAKVPATDPVYLLQCHPAAGLGKHMNTERTNNLDDLDNELIVIFRKVTPYFQKGLQ